MKEATALGISSGNRLTWEALKTIPGKNSNPILNFQDFAIKASSKIPDFREDPSNSETKNRNRIRNQRTAVSNFETIIEKLRADSNESTNGPVAPLCSTGINGLLRDQPVWEVVASSDGNDEKASFGIATVKLEDGVFEPIYVLLDGVEYQEHRHWTGVVRRQYEQRSSAKAQSEIEVSKPSTTSRIFTFKENLLSLSEYRERIRAEHVEYESDVLGVPEGKSCWHSDTKEDQDSRINAAIRARMLLIDENTSHKHTKANGFLFSDRSLMSLHDRFKSWPECIMFVQADGILLGYISGAPISSETFLRDTRIGSDSMNYNLPPEVIYWKGVSQEAKPSSVKAFCFSSIRISEHGIDLLFDNYKYKNHTKSEVTQQVGNLLLAGAKQILTGIQETSSFKFSRLYLFMHQKFVKEWYAQNVDLEKTADYCRMHNLPKLFDEKESSIEIGRIILSKDCLRNEDLLSLKGIKPATFHASYVSNR